MEEETFETYLNSMLAVLEAEKTFNVFEHLGSQIEMIVLELNLLKMFFRGLAYLEQVECDLHLRFAVKSMMHKLRQITLHPGNCTWIRMSNNQYFLNAIKDLYPEELKQKAMTRMIYSAYCKMMNLDVVMYDIGKKIDEQLRLEARDVCILLLGRDEYNCTSCPPSRKKFYEYIRDTTSFMDLIFQNHKAIISSNLIAPATKQQIGFIQVELKKYGMLMNHVEVNKLSKIITRARTWFIRISCLTYLYWSDEKYRTVSSITGAMFSGFLHQNMHVSTYGAISSMLQPTIIPQILARHLDFLLGDLVLPMKDSLQEALIFMLSFIMDPPDVNSKDSEMIWAQIYSTINKFPSLICSIRSCEIDEESFNNNFSAFLVKVDRVKAKVRELFGGVPYSSQFTSPNNNGVVGFLSILEVNLKSMLKRIMDLIPCSKHLWDSLCTEIELFSPFLKNIMELLEDDGDKEIKDLWTETLNMIYNVDYFTRLCLIGRYSAWYGIIALPDVIEHIKFIKIETNKLIGVDKIHNNKQIGGQEQMGGKDALRPRGMEGTENDSMGFKEVEENIINDLTRGPMSLTVISISGSGGQGKTTLAKRIYGNSNVHCRFHKVVWCYVSKDCPLKDLLIQILCDKDNGGGANELDMRRNVSLMEIEDLIVGVWRSFKGKRYFIVLDDIWDIDAWGQLKSLFPDDKNGSRILFTSRNQELASQAEVNSISHPLELFDDEENWELIRNRVFGSSDCDKEFEKIGRKIASCCKGLPLAAALIAGVLGRTEHKLDSWNKVAEDLKTHLYQEGCGNVLELSYRYLPDHLKPCFLYFAAFQRGKQTKAKRLKLLWIGEGFVNQYEGMNSSGEYLANEYLKDLVSLGLVVKEWSSSKGGIKYCRIHDFLYDLCLEKAKEYNFMHWADLNSDDERNIHFGSLVKCNHHRLCISECDPLIKPSPIVARRDLPTSPLHSFLCTSYASGESSLRFLESFKILTVLKLKLKVCEFPEVILSSICLRYLSLHFEERIEAIPPTIANLWKLRTLIIRNCIHQYLIKLPFVMWNMMSLRHVDIMFASFDLLGSDLENSSKSNIESLGILWFDADYGTTTEFLRKFPNLRKLKHITRERNIVELLSIVGSLPTKLESLLFAFVGEFDEIPHPIVWNFPKIPYLTKLKLTETQIPWSVLSEIGKQLPNLHVLKLYDGSCKGRSWKLEDGAFPNLTYLSLSDLSIEEFDVSCCDDPFPCLEYLHLRRTKLVEIPSVFGEINTLKEIHVSECSDELGASALRISEEQKEYGIDTLQVLIY